MDVVEEFPNKYNEDRSFVFWAFTSCSTNKDAAELFLEGAKGSMFQIDTCNAVNVRQLSKYPGEHEWLLPSCSELVVQHITLDPNRSTVVACVDNLAAKQLADLKAQLKGEMAAAAEASAERHKEEIATVVAYA